MQDKSLEKLFDYLKANRIYNKRVQESFYKAVIYPYETPNDKIISLLHHVANTQSQPNIDKLADFYKLLASKYDQLSSFRGFVALLNSEKAGVTPNYLNVFNGLQKSSGWGKKTAALLVKSIYHLHNGEYSKDLKIWKDAHSTFDKDERFYLPVDAVIQFIFKKLNVDCRYDFDGINNYLHRSGSYPGETMEIWDDLWFWGFITQKGGGETRTMEWNENKYWSLLYTNKDFNQIKEIEKRANTFIQIVREVK